MLGGDCKPWRTTSAIDVVALLPVPSLQLVDDQVYVVTPVRPPAIPAETVAAETDGDVLVRHCENANF